MKFADRLKAMIRAKSGNIWVKTKEESRAEKFIYKVALERKRKLFIWRSSTGLVEYQNTKNTKKNLQNPLVFAQNIMDGFEDGPAVIICEDISPFLNQPQFARFMKDISRKSQGRYPPKQQAQIIVVDNGPCPDGYIPVNLEIPDREELLEVVKPLLSLLPKEAQKEYESEEKQQEVVDCIVGLEADQATQSIAESLVATKNLDPVTLVGAKKRLLESSTAIQWTDPDPRGLEGIGGYDLILDYIKKRKRVFVDSQRNLEIPRPKGIIAAGVPGVGKSLLSKIIATIFGVPLLRFDVAGVFGGLVGESEDNMRKALQIAEAVSPCVLWIDEVDKGFAGASGSGESDGGVTKKVFGMYLTWQQDCEKPVFSICTANEPMRLPSEFFRHGRYDSVWWFDVPNHKDRKNIFEVLLKKYKHDVDNFDLEALAAESNSYTGSEIEQCIIEAMWVSYDEDRRVKTGDILAAAETITPILKGWGERGVLKEVRDWAAEAARPANDPNDPNEDVEEDRDWDTLANAN
jgi:hypothetical protein